jgi:ubiquitin-like 1-activating enzyme E1 B
MTTDAGSSNGQKLPTRTATKRTADDAELDAGETEAEQIAKRGKVVEENNKSITVDDDGAIMLD